MQNIDVSMMPQSALPEFRVSQGDVGRQMVATIQDDSGEDYAIPDGATTSIRWRNGRKETT